MLSNEGESLLQVAVRNNQSDPVCLLQEYHADITAVNSAGAQALHLAAIAGNKDMFKCLCEMGADLDATTSDGESCLDIAVKNNRKELIELIGITKKRREIMGDQVNATT